MIPKVFTAEIKGTPDEEQTMLFEFQHIVIRDFYRSYIKINQVKFKLPLLVSPSDLQTDLEEAVAEILGANPKDVRLECEVEFCRTESIPVVIIETKITDPLFI